MRLLLFLCAIAQSYSDETIGLESVDLGSDGSAAPSVLAGVSTWHSWAFQRDGDFLFVQSSGRTDIRLAFVSDSNGWFFFSLSSEPFRTLYGTSTELLDTSDFSQDWRLSTELPVPPLTEADFPAISRGGTQLTLNGTHLQILQSSGAAEQLLNSVLLAEDGTLLLQRNQGWGFAPWAGSSDLELPQQEGPSSAPQAPPDTAQEEVQVVTLEPEAAPLPPPGLHRRGQRPSKPEQPMTAKRRAELIRQAHLKAVKELEEGGSD